MLKGKRGFTLLEIMMVMIITGITLPAVGMAFYMLLRTPAQETAKLSVLNDVNLAFNWIHEDINRGQFFAGDPSMLKDIYVVDFTTDFPNSSAWSKAGIPTSPTDRGNPCGNYSLINASDSYKWVTSNTSTAGALDTQMFQLPVHKAIENDDIFNTVSGEFNLSSIVVSWKGNSNFSSTTCRTKVKIWDYSSSSWEELAVKSGMGSEGWLTGRKMFSNDSPPPDYIQDRKMYFLAETPYYKPPSCPHIYGWDGDNYQLIDLAISSSFMKRYESITYDSTAMLKPKDGYYDLMAAAQWPHDEYINSLGLWAVEHPEGTTALADGLGNVHTLSDPQPVTAVDSYGRDVTNLLSAMGDGAIWESDLSMKDFNNISQLHDWIEITLPDRPDDGIAKLVVDVASTTLSDTELDGFLHYILGSPNLGYAMDRIQNNSTDMQWFDYNLWLTAALRIQSWNGTDWIELENNPGILDMSGYLGRPQVVPIDLSQIQGDRIRLLTPAGMHLFDYVAVDYSPDEVVSIIELEPVEAMLHQTTDRNISVTQDVLSQIAATDDDYAYLEQGDYINYRFGALDGPAEGMQRTFIVPLGGYYYRVGPVEPEDKMENLELWEHLLYTPYAASQYFLPIYANPESYPDFQAFHSTKKFIQPEFLVNTTHNSLSTNYIRVMQLMTANASNTSTTSYGGFYWVDSTNASNRISYTTHYYYSNTSTEPNRLMREQWEDNDLVSTTTLAYNILYYGAITFDFNPLGTQSVKDILPYVVVTIRVPEYGGTGKIDTYTEWNSHLTLRSTTLSEGMAVLTTQAVGTGIDGISISGKKLFIDGSIRSLGNITVSGESHIVTGNLINGPAEAGGYIVDKGGAIADPKEFQLLSPVDWDMEVVDFVDNASDPASNEYIWNSDVDLNITDYDDWGKRIWVNSRINATPMLQPGVYYSVNGNISLGVTNVSGMVTLVSPNGRVTVTSADSLLNPFCNGVLLFSNASYDDAIRFSGDGGGWSGNLFAPYGGVKINGTMTKKFHMFGSIAAQRFNYSAESDEDFNIIY